MSRCPDKSDLYTYAEWKSNQMNVMLTAELDRAAAERLTNETKRYIEEMKQSSTEMDKMTNFSMERRKESVRYWQTEVNMKLEQIRLGIADLFSIERRLDKAFDTINENSHIVEKCIEARKRRQGFFLVYDPPEKHLCKEKEIMQEVMTLHCKTKREVTEQLRLLRKIRHEMEKEILSQITSFDLDMESNELQKKKIAIDNRTYDPECESGCSKKNTCCKKVSTLGMVKIEEWGVKVRTVLIEAEKQRQNTMNLLAIANNGLQETKEDLQRVKISADNAFRERINELRDHKSKMEDHIQSVLKQTQEMEVTSKTLVDQIWSFNKRISLEEAKLKENCSDDMAKGECVESLDTFLVKEYKKSKENVEKLKDNLACVQCSLKGLMRRKFDIEHDLNQCSEALLIDDYECMPMRQNIKYFIF